MGVEGEIRDRYPSSFHGIMICVDDDNNPYQFALFCCQDGCITLTVIDKDEIITNTMILGEGDVGNSCVVDMCVSACPILGIRRIEVMILPVLIIMLDCLAAHRGL